METWGWRNYNHTVCQITQFLELPLTPIVRKISKYEAGMDLVLIWYSRLGAVLLTINSKSNQYEHVCIAENAGSLISS